MKTGKIPQIDGNSIKELLSLMISSPSECGFEVYVITKSDPQLKRMGLYEDFRIKIKETIFRVLNEKYNSAEAEYVPAERIADEQKKIYIIETREEFSPFAMLQKKEGEFSKTDITDATGIAFSIKYNRQHLWAYQHLWTTMLPNKSKKNWMGRMISKKEGVIFEELKDPIITLADRIDLLVLDDYIITADYGLLQRSFGFQDYIRIRANETIKTIESAGIVSNIDKLNEYVNRPNGNPKYAKKMMRVAESKVLKMDSDKLLDNIHKSRRWNGKLKEVNGQFVLEHYTDVERLIDLLDERYTRSEITDTEYDTDVKQVADPV